MKVQPQIATVERTESADVRILSWNILSEELSPGLPTIESRIDGICAYILQYMPDAAGIQEISETAYGLLAERIGHIYEFVNPKTKENLFSFTGIAYNKLKYRLLDSDIINFEVGNPRIRIMNYIYLEELDEDRSFVLLSTHWDRRACNRGPHAEHMAKQVLELEKRYGVPVICTGDFNARESTMAYKIFMEGSGHLDAKFICPEPINNCFTGHPIDSPIPEFMGGESIDHITVTKDVQVLHYENVVDGAVIHLSDHFPVYVDLKFRSETVVE